MRKTWLIFAAMCSVVMGIVIFCVIFGGYTSLLRAKNRINAAKSLMTAQCQKTLDLLPDLAAMAQTMAEPEILSRIKKNNENIGTILMQMESSKDPVQQDLIHRFEQSLILLAQDIKFLGTESKNHPSVAEDFFKILKTIEQLQVTAFYATRRHNKEARYFNTRKKVFPGFLVAKLFGLEKLQFPEIETNSFQINQTIQGSSAL